jgi:signal transduction histidine kinase
VGAEAAIEDLVNRTRSRGLEVDLSVALAFAGGRQPDRLSSDVETALYRIIQEALNNAQQHGEARQAWVEVEEDARTVRVMIRDDGRGFDTTAKTTGFGLMGTHERAELAGGWLSVTSVPGEGATIRATLPSERAGRLIYPSVATTRGGRYGRVGSTASIAPRSTAGTLRGTTGPYRRC